MCESRSEANESNDPGGPGDPSRRITFLLEAAGGGDASAAEQLWQLVYDQLHRVARSQMRRGGKPGDLQTTVLVHEAYLRLLGNQEDSAGFANRKHFFAAAAQAMRRIRVDDARRRGRAKRGGGRKAVTLEAVPGVFDADPNLVLAIDEALDGLRERDPQKAEVVMLRFFAGMTIDETAEAMDLSPSKISSEWRYARTWLYRELSKGDTRPLA